MPGAVVVQGALIMCAAGAAPGALQVTSQEVVRIDGMAVATIMDFAPEVNIPS